MRPLQGHRHWQRQEGDAQGDQGDGDESDDDDKSDNDDGGVSGRDGKVGVPGWGSSSYATLEPLLDGWMAGQLDKVDGHGPVRVSCPNILKISN